MFRSCGYCILSPPYAVFIYSDNHSLPFIPAIRCNGTSGGDGAIFDSHDDPPVPTAYCLSSNYPLISYSLLVAHQRGDTHVDANVTRCGLLPMSLPNLKVDTISFQPISTFPVPTPFVTVPSIPTFANPSIPTFSFPSSLPSGSSAHDDKTMHCALGGASAFLTLVISFVTLAALQKRKKASESSMRPLATSVPLRAPHAEIVEVQAVERPRDLEQAQEVEQPRQVKRLRLRAPSHYPLFYSRQHFLHHFRHSPSICHPYLSLPLHFSTTLRTGACSTKISPLSSSTLIISKPSIQISSHSSPQRPTAQSPLADTRY